jgi:hypothetical protein
MNSISINVYGLCALAAVLIYVIYKERQSLGCPNIPTGEDCNNAEGKAVKGCKSRKDMPSKEILGKIKFASNYEDRWVKWRMFFMTAIFVTFSVTFILHERLPSGKEIIIFTSIIMLALTLTSNFYKFHLSNHVTKSINESVKILKSRL